MAPEELNIASVIKSKLLELLKSILIYYDTFPALSSVADPDLKLGKGRGGFALLALPAYLPFAMFFFPRLKGEGAGHAWSLRYISCHRDCIFLQMTQNI